VQGTRQLIEGLVLKLIANQHIMGQLGPQNPQSHAYARTHEATIAAFL
jgi:hypothetical protein